jgi:CubicO group peptidase (beta-lactamase class C family)
LLNGPQVKHAAVLLALLTTTGAAPSSWLDSTQLRAVDAVFQSYSSHTPGCALGIYHDGSVAYARGYGMADLERPARITPDSLFDVGSVSKQFSAAAIVLLADAGKLSLNDDVRKYIPEMPNYGAPITLNELMWHTSGLRDYTDLLTLEGYGLEQATTDEQALASIVRQRGLEFPSGTQYEYSNTNYFLLSVIVKRVTGKTLAQFVEQRIFHPLHMTETTYRTDYAMLIPDRAMGYAPAEGGHFQNSMSNWQQTGDGGVQLSITDAIKWDENFYHPSVGGQRMIETLQTRGHLANGKRLSYARGLFIGSYRGLPMVYHGGAWIGYRAEFDRYPTVHTSIVLLCNSDAAHPAALAQQVADVVLKRYLNGAAGSSSSPVYANPIVARYLTGTYFDPIGGDIYRIAAHANGIALDAGGTSYPLRAVDRTTFQIGSTTVRFTLDSDGNATVLTLTAAGESTRAERYTAWKPVASDLSAATGEYHSADLDTTWRLRANNSTLVVEPSRNLPVGAAGPLTPILRDTFSYEGGGFTIRLERDSSGTITGFMLGAGRGLRALQFTRV